MLVTGIIYSSTGSSKMKEYQEKLDLGVIYVSLKPIGKIVLGDYEDTIFVKIVSWSWSLNNKGNKNGFSLIVR